MNNKRNKILTIIFSVMIILFVFGVSYAYFAIDTTKISADARIQTGGVSLIFDDKLDEKGKIETHVITPNDLLVTRHTTSGTGAVGITITGKSNSCTVYCTRSTSCSTTRPTSGLYGEFTCTNGMTGSRSKCYYGETKCDFDLFAGSNYSCSC